MSDYFDIPNPDKWQCSMHTLDEEGTLKLRLVSQFDDVLWIIFQGAVYLNIFTNWKGAKFSKGSSEDCLAILRSLSNKHLQSASDNELLNKYKLFQIKNESLQDIIVQIIAHSAKISEFDEC